LTLNTKSSIVYLNSHKCITALERAPITSDQWIIQAEGITKVYRRGQEQIHALRGVDLQIKAGDFAALLGPSGGGKSTLLHLLGAIDTPSAGRLTVCNVSLDQASESERTRLRREKVSFIFQFYNLMPSLSAQDNVALPLLARGCSWGEARHSAEESLRSVGLDHRLKHNPGQLSGGEQQRVAIARALVTHPDLILADEPTGDLDSVATQDVLDQMLALNRQAGITFIVATHNMAVANAATSIFELHDGQLAPRRNNP
jgi:putative ABC transport system ATP-binding protein